MYSVTVIGKGVYADSLAKVLSLAFKVYKVQVAVRDGSQQRAIQDVHLSKLQKATTLFLCCDDSLSAGGLSHWVKSLRENDSCIVAEIVILVNDEYRANCFRTAPIFFDNRELFTLDKIKGHKVLTSGILYADILKICVEYCEIYPGEWSQIIHESYFGKLQSLFRNCRILYGDFAQKKEFREAVISICEIMVADDKLSWPQLLGLDSHNPKFPSIFNQIKNEISLINFEDDFDLGKTWKLINELSSYISLEV